MQWSRWYLSSGAIVGRDSLVEQTEAHVGVRILLLFLLLLLLGSRGSSVATRSSASGRGGGSVGLGVGNAVLELLDLIPLVVGLNGNREKFLVGVDDGVHNGGQGGVVDSQGDGGDRADGRRESLEQLGLLNVQDGGVEGLTVVVDLRDTHTVGEGRDVQQVEKGSLGGTDLVTSLNELEVGGNFDGTTGNLGGDTEGLEERGLTRLHTGVSSGNEDIERGEGTGTSGGGDTVVENLHTDLLEVVVGKDEADVACHVSVRRRANRCADTDP